MSWGAGEMRWKSGFRTKAIIGFGGTLAATVFVALVAVVQVRSGAERATQAARVEAQELLLIQRVRFRLERSVADVQAYLLSGDPALLPRMQNSWSQVDSALQLTEEPTESLAARTQLRKVIQTAGAFREIVDQAVAEREAGRDAETIQRFERRLMMRREELDAAVSHLWNEEMQSLDGGMEAARRSYRRAWALILGTAIAGVLLSLLFARIAVRELARLYEREEQAARRARGALAARDDLLAIIAHDLRSPLAAILMKVELIRKKAPPGPLGADVRRHAESIDGTARRMEYLTNSLLDAATIEAGGLSMSRARCEVQDLLTATLEMFQPLAADKAIQLVVVTPDEALAVWTERERMLQVLSNLVSNALKFTAEGGTVTLRAEQVLADVRFSVSDTGVGIAEDQRSRVFERYWKADTGGGRRGAGLGLYIARGIVEAGRGRIWFETRLDRGTTFFFTSPSADPEITESVLQCSATSDGAPFRNGAGRGDATDTPR